MQRLVTSPIVLAALTGLVAGCSAPAASPPPLNQTIPAVEPGALPQPGLTPTQPASPTLTPSGGSQANPALNSNPTPDLSPASVNPSSASDAGPTPSPSGSGLPLLPEATLQPSVAPSAQPSIDSQPLPHY
jgi:hypothetical protein